MTTIFKMNNLRLAILGPSGGGKGTQAALLARQFGLAHLSVGDLFRREVKRETGLGGKLRKFLDVGKLAPDELTLAVLFRALKKILPGGFIIDGVPRTLNQAKLLDEFLQRHGCPLDGVVLLELPDRVIISRRRQMESQGKPFQPGRQDDKENILRQRLAFYKRNISSIKKYYRQKGILIPVDGARVVSVINDDLAAMLATRFNEGR